MTSSITPIASTLPAAVANVNDDDRVEELTLKLESCQRSLTIANQQMDMMQQQLRQLTKTSPLTSPNEGNTSNDNTNATPTVLDSSAVMIRNELLREENTHLANDLDRVQRVFFIACFNQ
jgi:hypothetical protein